jgi:hypothetical protein
MIFTTSKSFAHMLHRSCDIKLKTLTQHSCRFGNFIGEDVESEEASDAGVEAADYVYDEEPEETGGVTGQELMELDGLC